ncbi:hypothetical protein ACS5PN_03785 [Roseateles sp. NT4]|uniref:hypothetical protein n=1 Tax=Roseateles sp. NT4 TaxID=3453715 RepID=UPI003EF02D7D
MNFDSIAPWVAPLDRFIAPPGLDGRQGSNRMPADRKRNDAQTDAQAIQAWLSSLKTSRIDTIRLYRSAAEKLLNWACFARGKALSSLNADDLRAFVEFLAAPRPALDWIGARCASRDSVDWRPFTGPLAQGSIRATLTINALLFGWLSAVGYAAMPEIKTADHARSRRSATDVSANSLTRSPRRTLSAAGWGWVRRHLEGPIVPITRLAVELEYFSNFKPAEIRELRQADCVAPSDECVAWRIWLASMKTRARCVFALPPVGSSLAKWFEAQGIEPRKRFASAEERAESPLLFGAGIRPDHRVRSVLHCAAGLASAGGDGLAADELLGASQRCFRNALEAHAGPDHPVTPGFVANMPLLATTTGLYFRRIIPTDAQILAGWEQLKDHWASYSDRLDQMLGKPAGRAEN